MDLFLIQRIFSHLSLEQIWKFRLVCSDWRELAINELKKRNGNIERTIFDEWFLNHIKLMCKFGRNLVSLKGQIKDELLVQSRGLCFILIYYHQPQIKKSHFCMVIIRDYLGNNYCVHFQNFHKAIKFNLHFQPIKQMVLIHNESFRTSNSEIYHHQMQFNLETFDINNLDMNKTSNVANEELPFSLDPSPFMSFISHFDLSYHSHNFNDFQIYHNTLTGKHTLRCLFGLMICKIFHFPYMKQDESKNLKMVLKNFWIVVCSKNKIFHYKLMVFFVNRWNMIDLFESNLKLYPVLDKLKNYIDFYYWDDQSHAPSFVFNKRFLLHPLLER